MGILDIQEKTLDQKKTDTASDITDAVQSLYRVLIASYGRIYSKVWANSDGLTAQQVCDSMGTNGGDLFRLAISLKTLVNTAKPGSLTQVEHTITVSDSGNVTVVS